MTLLPWIFRWLNFLVIFFRDFISMTFSFTLIPWLIEQTPHSPANRRLLISCMSHTNFRSSSVEWTQQTYISQQFGHTSPRGLPYSREREVAAFGNVVISKHVVCPEKPDRCHIERERAQHNHSLDWSTWRYPERAGQVRVKCQFAAKTQLAR